MAISPTVPSTARASAAWASAARAASATSVEVLPIDSTIPASTCPISDTARWVSFCTVSMTVPISWVACTERSASRRTSSATTAKPLPASPARAASMAALRASRLVWSAIPSITLTILPISSDRSPIEPIASWSRSPLWRASSTDCRLTWSTWCTRAAMAPTFSIIVVSVPVARSTAPSRTSPFWAVWTSVALIS